MNHISYFFRVQEHGDEPTVPFSCILEKTLVDMPEDEAAKYCKESNVQRHVIINSASYSTKCYLADGELYIC